MPTNDADALAEVVALCAAARAKLPASGFHRLRVLLDMLLIDLDRAASPPRTAEAPAVETKAGSAPERASNDDIATAPDRSADGGDSAPGPRPDGADTPNQT